MRDATYRLTLDVSNRSYQTQLTAKLNDSARTILANLTEDGVPYIIEDGCSAVIMIKKPDGNVLFNDCEIVNNNVVKYEFTSQTVSVEGLLECEIRVYGNYNTILTSPRFRILVEANVYDDGQVESESEFSALTAAITAVNTLDLDVSKVGDTATVTLTKKDGTEEEVEIHDGASAEIVGATATVGDSQGTPTVLVTEGGTSLARTFAFAFDGLKGETGPAGKITEVTASIDHMAGYPRVVVTEGGTDEAKTLNFAFHNLKGEQGATGPRGEKGETGDVGTISNVTASVDGNVGTPTVVVTEGGTQQEKTYDFAFHNLKGIQGEKGEKGDVGVISGLTASVDSNVGTPSVVVTEGGTSAARTYDLAFHNLKGVKGDAGEITSVTASVDSNVGTPEVTVTEGGTSSEKTLAFAFKNLKGVKGDTGNGVASFVLVSGTHAPGTTDVYRMTFTDGTTANVGVYNGADGTGASISAMTDVQLTSLANGQILQYDSSSSKWKNANLPTVDDTLSSSSTNAIQNKAVKNALDGKLNVVTSAVQNNIPTFGANGALADSGKSLSNYAELDNSGKVPSSLLPDTSLVGLTDVSVVSPTNGQALVYNSTTQKWENDDVSAVAELGDLTNVQLSTPTEGQALVYDADTQKWVNGTTAKTSNKNLLDNGWFTVNQRGQSSYTEYGYCLDRWRKNTTASSGDVVAVNDNGIFVTIVNASETGGHLLHFLETSVGDSLEGKTCTASVLLGNGTLVQGSAVYNSASDVVFINTSQFQVFARKSSSSNLHCLRIKFAATNGLQIRAVKLELGSTSTLANDEAPDYSEELRRCRRFYVRWNFGSGAFFATGIAGSTRELYTSVQLGTPMRAKPNISAYVVKAWDASNSILITTWVTSGFFGDGFTLKGECSSGLTLGKTYMLMSADANSYIEFNADL